MGRMPLLKFFINYIELEESPDGWQSLTLTLKHDRELKGVFEQCEVQLTFWKDGYDLIYEYEQENGFTYSVPFEIREYDETADAYLPIFTGKLFIRDVIFGEGAKGSYAKVKIEDNSFFSKIYNNRNIKCKLYAPSSKNGVTITPAQYEQIRFFRPSSGFYYGLITGSGNERNQTGFKIYEVLRYLTAFMTDDTVDFESDTFGPGGKYENYMITCGYVCRFANTAGLSQELFETYWPDISFSEVIQELNKALNVGFTTGVT